MARFPGSMASVILAFWAGVLTTSSALAQAPVTVEAPERFKDVSMRIAAIGDERLRPALRLTGLDAVPPGVRVILVGSDSPVAAELPPWVSGFAVAERRVIVLFPDRVPSYPVRSLEALVVHEIAHIMVAEATRGQRPPRWLNEGVATVAAREWDLEDRARYAVAVVGRGAGSTRALDEGFDGDAASAARSYALSAALVRFLISRYDENVTARILHSVGEGLPFSVAFRQATGDSLSSVEKAFFEDEAFWYTWVPFLTSSAALWMAITLLALLAIRRRRERSRQLREAWDLQEEAALASGSRWSRTSSPQPREWVN